MWQILRGAAALGVKDIIRHARPAIGVVHVVSVNCRLLIHFAGEAPIRREIEKDGFSLGAQGREPGLAKGLAHHVVARRWHGCWQKR